MPIHVHDLAKQLGISSQQVLEEARRAGAYARSASSLLSDEVVAAVRAATGSVGPVEPSGQALAPPAGRTRRSAWPNPFAMPRPPRSGDDWWDDEWDRRDPDVLLSAREVARELGVTAAAVRQWASRGYLQASSMQGRKKLYRRGDAISAQRTAHRKTLRTPAPFPVPPSLLQRPVTTREAARICGVAESTIRIWVHRGRLAPLPKGSGRGHRFDPMVVLATARELPARRPKRST
ncbi:translation initiation factor IF-2 N-terminal domain-containing protein [Promicromonospora sp. NPDC050880]|uniref:translation initiation factor IF-2 N-terminal domain-containing protein n=1 Tax=Promicromonospora sp. NPDC050880 TaxID=3364406 RepID=UPI0037955D0D